MHLKGIYILLLLGRVFHNYNEVQVDIFHPFLSILLILCLLVPLIKGGVLKSPLWVYLFIYFHFCVLYFKIIISFGICTFKIMCFLSKLTIVSLFNNTLFPYNQLCSHVFSVWHQYSLHNFLFLTCVCMLWHLLFFYFFFLPTTLYLKCFLKQHLAEL